MLLAFKDVIQLPTQIFFNMKKFQYEIEGLFPTPVYTSFDIKKFTKAELNLVETHKNKVYGNVGNTTSTESYILNKPIFKKLKNIITDHTNEYFKKTFVPKNKDLKLYITQSWLNYTLTDQFHHGHVHQNSLVSGVLYIKANKDFDSIVLEDRTEYTNLKIYTEDYNVFNSQAWTIPIEAGMLIMFPSTTVHKVKTKKDSNERISLAFNTFVKGTLGHAKELTELII